MEENILLYILRVLSAIAAVYLLTRLMGKKQIAQLTLFDYVAGISIGTIAANLAIDPDRNYLLVFIVLVLWGLVPIVLSLITLKNKKSRHALEDTPTILVQKGKIVEKNLTKTRLNINDLMAECRQNGAFSLSDVEFAILETDGKVSVLKKSEVQPVTPKDIHMPPPPSDIAVQLVMDGRILTDNFASIGKNETWLRDQLLMQGIPGPEGVLLAYLDADGSIKADRKGNDPDILKFS